MEMKNGELMNFRIEFITSEDDSDEVSGKVNDEKKVVELFEVDDSGNEIYKGFIPFSSIKKLEIINEDTSSEQDEEE